jgi:hypothetical protein
MEVAAAIRRNPAKQREIKIWGEHSLFRLGKSTIAAPSLPCTLPDSRSRCGMIRVAAAQWRMWCTDVLNDC